MRYLVDVDGVVADLMGGFERFFLERTGERIDSSLSTTHSISKSPAHANLNSRFDLKRLVDQYLGLPDVYQDYIGLVPDASWAIRELDRRGHEVGFVTAILKAAPSSYVSKARWLDEHFPGIPLLTAASEEKHWVTGDRAIDDRYDTCFRWEQVGVRTLLFRRSWNEAPPGTRSYDWREIVDADLW